MYAIIDVETTGGKFYEQRVTDIAIYRFEDGVSLENMVSLVDPERGIDPFVSKLTGITEQMVKNAPKFYQLAKRIIKITEGCVIVGHGVDFDYKILKMEYQRLGYDFKSPTLCTLGLSRALIPGLPSYSLGNLAKSLGIPFSQRHRANGDALVTLQLFKLLLDKDTQKTIVKSALKTDVTTYQMAPSLLKILDELPHTSGLYYIHNKDNQIIYIGESGSIKRDVTSLLASTSDKADAIRNQISDVHFEKTGSRLIAALKYIQELNLNKPLLNTGPKRPSTPSYIIKNYPKDMIIIDSGRDAFERSIVLIKDGRLKGYGYYTLNYQLRADILESIITPMKNTATAVKTITTFLNRNKNTLEIVPIEKDSTDFVKNLDLK